jgi:oxygen tolerance protein BatD
MVGPARRALLAKRSPVWAYALRAVALSLALPLAAQDVALQASVDRSVIRDNESFTYTIRADGPVRGEPELGPLRQQFDVLGSSSEKRVGIVNGRTSQVTTWTYQLMPKAAGDYTLPAVRVDNQQTNAVSLRVTPPPTSTASAPADIFMELDAQPSTIYVQAQVVFTLRLFIGVSTGRATLTQPEITGGEAIVERLGEDSQYTTDRAGRNFIVRERRYAIFPQQPGPLTIGPATFEAMVIPDRGFSRVQRFRSGSLELEVLPAVAPPASLASAVWLPAQRVTLSEHWSEDAGELAVGVPRTREVKIEADGLLETQLPELPLPQPMGIRQYVDQPELERALTPQGFQATRTVSMAVIAQTPGEIELPKLQLPWFNVAAQRWEVAELPARTLTVAPSGDAASEAPEPVAAPTAASAPASSPMWRYVSAFLALGWLATALFWWRSSNAAKAGRRRTVQSAKESERRPSERKLLRELKSACTAGDADAARRALLDWGEARYASSPPRSLGALASELPEPVSREVLDLEAHIYGATTGRWDGRGLAAAIDALEVAAKSRDPAKEPLLPLYR